MRTTQNQQNRPVLTHLQDLGQLPAALQLRRGLVDVVKGRLHLLGPLLQRGFEQEAAQPGLVLRNRQHLKRAGGQCEGRFCLGPAGRRRGTW